VRYGKDLREKPYNFFSQYEKTYGDIVKLDFGAHTLILSFDPTQWENLFRSAGKYPEPLPLFPLLERERRKRKKDSSYMMVPLALEGEEWRQNRNVLDKKFMHVTQVQKYMSRFNDIGDDLVKIIANQSQKNGYLPNLENIFYAYSTEGVGSVIFDYRIRVLNDPVPEKAQEFLSTLQQTFSVMSHLIASIPLYYYIDTPNGNYLIRNLIN